MNIWCLHWWQMFLLILYFNRNYLRVLGGRTIAHHSQQPAAPSPHFPSLSVKQGEKLFGFLSRIFCASEHKCPVLSMRILRVLLMAVWQLFNSKTLWTQTHIYMHIFFRKVCFWKIFFSRLNESQEILVSSLNTEDLRPQNLLLVDRWGSWMTAIRLDRLKSSVPSVIGMLLCVHCVSVVTNRNTTSLLRNSINATSYILNTHLCSFQQWKEIHEFLLFPVVGRDWMRQGSSNPG